MSNLTIELYNLIVVADNMSDILCSYQNWNDDVSKSYERFVDSLRSNMSNLEFTLKDIENAISSLISIDVNKQVSAMSEFKAKFARL